MTDLDRGGTHVKMEHLGYLDGWRGLAIGFLLLGHFYPVPGLNFGTFGVNLFFVLSGWLMTRLLFIQNTAIPIFYKRRISRIFPAHFFFLATVVVVVIVFDKAINWREVWAAVFFINNYFPGEPAETVMPFGHMWSLAVEEHSYILLSLIAMTSRKRWVSPIVAIGACCLVFAGIGIWYASRFTGAELSFGKWIHTEVSAYGIFISAFFVLFFQKHEVRQLPIMIFVGLAVCALGAHWWSVSNPIRTFLGVGALALIVNLLASAPSILKTALSIAPLRLLGTWSFSIYLWQQPFYLLSRRGEMPTFLALTISIALGLVSFYLVERPVRSFLNHVWARTPPIDAVFK